MPAEKLPAFVRGAFSFNGPLASHFDSNTSATLINSFKPGFKLSLEKLVFVPAVNFAGAGGSLTFQLRKGGPTGPSIATLTINLASATLGAVLEASVAATDDLTARLGDNDTFSLTRDAAGTAFTTANGTWFVYYRTRPQARR